jgi:hypothetical protein
MLRSVYLTLGAGTNNLKHAVGNERLWLIGANLEVTDSAGNSVNNVAGNIWVQSINEENSLSLAVGNMRNGQIAGFGCLPLDVGQEIVGRIYHATANYIGKLNLNFMTDVDAIKLGVTPNWQSRIDAIPTFQYGKLKTISDSGSPDDTVITLRPADGYIYKVLMAMGWHDSDNAETVQWKMTDGTTTAEWMITAGNIAANTKKSVYSPTANYGVMCVEPLIVTYDVYLQFEISTPSAGETVYIDAVVLEYCE